MHHWMTPCESRVLFATVPAGFTDIAYGASIGNGTAMEFAPDGRLFVATQSGQLRVISNTGALLATPAASLTVDSNGERGLLGIAFDPNFSTNQFIYLYYTATTPAVHNRVSRFTLSGDTVVTGSELPIFDLPNLSATNHNGGAIHFGIDGKLYIGVGENAVASNAQSLTTTLGKMLRINSDGTIPTDNPFYGSTTGNNRAIWTMGLRNPFAFAIQPGTGKIAINDVGQNTWEEVNVGVAGANYGWSTTEGDFDQAAFPALTRPRYTYDHNNGSFITGGAFYNPSVPNPYPNSFIGRYFLTDGGQGWIKTIDPNGATSKNDAAAFLTGASTPVDLKTGPDGFLYYLQRGGTSGVRRVTTIPLTATTPQFNINGTAPAGQNVAITFSRDINGSQSAGDLIVTDRDTNLPIPSAQMTIAYNAATRTATWSYNNAAGIFPDGNYRAVLPAGVVDDVNDIPTTQGAQVDFFVLAGDATQDRIVDTQDFNILAENFGTAATAFTSANFNYADGVDSVDFDILVNQFGKRLAPTPEASAPGARIATTAAPPSSIFADTHFQTDDAPEDLLVTA